MFMATVLSVLVQVQSAPISGYTYTGEPTVLRRDNGWECGHWRPIGTGGVVRTCERSK